MKINYADCTVYFGVPGSGKSVFLASIVHKMIKKGIKVYSNYPFKGADVIDCKKYLGKYALEENSILVIDEAGIEYNNRDFKTFPKENLYFFKMHRHYKVEVVLASQTFDDMDLKIRGVCNKLFIVRRSLIPYHVVAIPIHKRIGINEVTKDICDEYYVDGALRRLFTSKRVFMPFYWKDFDTFDVEKLPNQLKEINR